MICRDHEASDALLKAEAGDDNIVLALLVRGVKK